MKYSIILTQSTKKAERRIESAEFKFKGDAIKSANEVGNLFAELRHEQLTKKAKLSIPFNLGGKFKLAIQTEKGIFYATNKASSLGIVNETASNYSVRERVYKGKVTTSIESDFDNKTVAMKSEIYHTLCNAFNLENMVKLSSSKVTKQLQKNTSTKLIGC